MISNQKFNVENQVARLCVAVLVIFNTFPVVALQVMFD